MTLPLTPLTPGMLPTDSPGVGVGGSCLVAAYNAPDLVQSRADFVCDGTADEEEINEAIAACTAGGRVMLSEGDFLLASRVVMYLDGVELTGFGVGYPSGGSMSNYASSPVTSGTRLQAQTGFSDDYIVDCRPTGNLVTSLTAGLTAQAQRTVSGAANNGSGLIRITTSTVHPWNTSDRVAVYGVLGTTEANGVWVVTKIDTTHIDLQGSTFSHAYTSGGSAEKVLDVVLASTTGLPASGTVWIQGSVIGTGAETTYASIQGLTLKDTYGAPTALTGAQVNYAPRSLAGIALKDFSVDAFGAGSPFIDVSGVYWNTFASLMQNVRIQRLQGDGIVSDGGGTTTASTLGTGPRGAWDNRYMAVQVRQVGGTCMQLVAGSSDNIIGADSKFAAWGAYGVYVHTGSGAQILDSHFYGATAATGQAIYADARQLMVGNVRIANVAGGGIYITGLTAQGGGATLSNVNIRDCDAANSGTKDAITVRAQDGGTIRGIQMMNLEFQATDDNKRARYLINLDDSSDAGVAATGTGVTEDVSIGRVSWGYQNDATSAYRTAPIRVGRAGVAHVRPSIEQPRRGVTQVLTDAATVTVDAQAGDHCTLSTNASRTIAAPSNLLPGCELAFEILNNGGSAVVTWDAAYTFIEPWANPANGKKRNVRFRSLDGSTLIQTGGVPIVVDRDTIARSARAVISENVPWTTCVATAIPTTAVANGTLMLSLTGLRAGDVITNLVCFVATVGTSLTLVKMGLFTKTGTFLRATADASASFNGSTGFKVLPLTSTYTVTVDDGFYIGFLQVGTTGAALQRAGTGTLIGAQIGSGARSNALVLTQSDISGNVTPADGNACWWFAAT